MLFENIKKLKPKHFKNYFSSPGKCHVYTVLFLYKHMMMMTMMKTTTTMVTLMVIIIIIIKYNNAHSVQAVKNNMRRLYARKHIAYMAVFSSGSV